MTFGGTQAKPNFSSPPPERPSEPDTEFGWTPQDEPGASGAASGSGDWKPEGDNAAGVNAGGELLVEDDSRWRGTPATEMSPTSGASAVRAVDNDAQLLKRCEGWLQSALQKPQPSALMRAIKAGGCNALAGGIKCVLCEPKGPQLTGVAAYYRSQTGRVLLCADRLKSEEETTAALSHELVHAYDFCRRGLRIPFVRTQVPWALDCPSEACSEVRAYSLTTYADAPPWVDKRTLVYRSALGSLLSNPSSQCGGDERCTAALAAIFERCAADAAPFNEEGRSAEMRGSYPAMEVPKTLPPPAPAAPAPPTAGAGGISVRGIGGGFSGNGSNESRTI
jgi:inner membrane protease ATP23